MRSSRILYANSCTINTYRKSACNTCRMNTYETKDLKFSRINTYKKTGGGEREAPGSLGESGNKRGASAVRKSGGATVLPDDRPDDRPANRIDRRGWRAYVFAQQGTANSGHVI